MKSNPSLHDIINLMSIIELLAQEDVGYKMFDESNIFFAFVEYATSFK